MKLDSLVRIALSTAPLTALLMILPAAASASADLSFCRSMSSDSKRLTCYDAIADSQKQTMAYDVTETDNIPTAAASTLNTAKPEKELPREVIQAETLFGKNESEQRDQIEATLGYKGKESIRSILASVSRNAYKQYVVKLENGQVWRQYDSTRLSLKAGDDVVIRKASFGSYQLKKTTGNVTLRVKRID